MDFSNIVLYKYSFILSPFDFLLLKYFCESHHCKCSKSISFSEFYKRIIYIKINFKYEQIEKNCKEKLKESLG